MAKIKWGKNPSDEEILANFINVETGLGRGIHGEEAWVEDSLQAFQEVDAPSIRSPEALRGYISEVVEKRTELQAQRGDKPSSKPAETQPDDPPDDKKEKISIRLDKEVLEYFKKDGTRWQSRINDALREYMLTKTLNIRL